MIYFHFQNYKIKKYAHQHLSNQQSILTGSSSKQWMGGQKKSGGLHGGESADATEDQGLPDVKIAVVDPLLKVKTDAMKTLWVFLMWTFLKVVFREVCAWHFFALEARHFLKWLLYNHCKTALCKGYYGAPKSLFYTPHMSVLRLSQISAMSLRAQYREYSIITNQYCVPKRSVSKVNNMSHNGQCHSSQKSDLCSSRVVVSLIGQCCD